nr:S41 family peptidase [uncultured Sediminibacterium sp.]
MLYKKNTKLLIIILLNAICIIGNTQNNINLKFFNNINTPGGWNLGYFQNDSASYILMQDETYKVSKDASLKLINRNYNDINQFGSVYYTINNEQFKGRNITLSGYLKTKNITSGFAGLFLALLNGNNAIHYDNMKNLNINGSIDWRKFTITLPYSQEITKITFGGLLAGNGQLWIDSLSLKIDEIEITKLNGIRSNIEDSLIKITNHIDYKIDNTLLNSLELLGEVWAFIKYHHEEVAKGLIDMDKELLIILPNILKSKTEKEAKSIISNWINSFEVKSECSSCQSIWKENKDKNLQNNLYGNLFKSDVFPKKTVEHLQKILYNTSLKTHHYIDLNNNIGNPKFTNEHTFETNQILYPSIRLIALFRYWASVQYFYPYRNLLGKKWDNLLLEFIPIFLTAKDEEEYTIACMKLFSSLYDAHTWINGTNKAKEKYLGIYHPPIKVKFISDTLVINQVMTTDPKDKTPLVQRGDIITAIDGVSVGNLVKKMISIVPGANLTGKLREISEIILRGNSKEIKLDILRNNELKKIVLNRIALNQINFPSPDIALDGNGMAILNDSIGYLYPGKYLSMNLETIKNKLRNTSGLIIDLRCYPSDFIPFGIGNYIKSVYSPFVSYTTTSINYPGYFEQRGVIYNGGGNGEKYNKRVVVLVNEQTQSSAEYTTMALQSGDNVVVIGSTTAGTDGNMSKIMLPGGIETNISGVGIYYPDKSPTQRVGIKIDIPVKIKIDKIKDNIDEMLIFALKYFERK